MPQTVAAIILAAGRSSRMENGHHKLLLPLGDRAVLSHVVSTVLASKARPLVIVLGYRAEQIRALLSPYAVQPEVMVIENPEYQQGMSTSLRKGIETLMMLPYIVDGALIILGDQPLMTPDVINAMIETRQDTGKLIVAALYNGQRGNPTFFDARLFPELLAITGDEGARTVLARHRQEMATIDVDDDTLNYDVDTWESYQQVVTVWERRFREFT